MELVWFCAPGKGLWSNRSPFFY